jgi:hypothetical protein
LCTYMMASETPSDWSTVPTYLQVTTGSSDQIRAIF